MPQTLPRLGRKIHGSALADWLQEDGEGTQEIIVEAAVPARKVTFRRGADGRYRPEPPTALRGAAAFAVRANSDQLRHIAQHPLVRAIRPNRRRRL